MDLTASPQPAAPAQAMMSGVSWSSTKAMRSRSCSLRFFKRCNCNRSGAGETCNATIAASRSRCSCRSRVSSSRYSRSSVSVIAFKVVRTADHAGRSASHECTRSGNPSDRRQNVAAASGKIIPGSIAARKMDEGPEYRLPIKLKGTSLRPSTAPAPPKINHRCGLRA